MHASTIKTLFSEPNPSLADFPDAPEGWTVETAKQEAEKDGLELSDAQLEVIRTLQAYFSTHDEPTFHARELHDALEEKFHTKGGLKYLYELYPGGPIAQGCRIAGIKPPTGSESLGFGSVM